MKKIICFMLTLVILASCVPFAAAAEEGKEVKILFTHDIHSFFLPSEAMIDGKVREHGGAARLKTVLDENRDENTVYLDAGDFSMGTLLHAGFLDNAYELRLLGALGCDVTTLGNHEFDFDGTGTAKMLESALASGDRLPKLVQSNMVIDGELTKDQKTLADAMNDYGAEKYTFLEVNGVKIAVFGLLGIDGIECAPTSGMDFTDYIKAAEATVDAINDDGGADLIVCLSHCGTDGDGENGEDFKLADKVPEIDVIISGHSHSTYKEPVTVGDTIVVSAGEYLANLGSLTLSVTKDGAKCTEYKLIPIDGSVASDKDVEGLVAEYKDHIEKTYLADEGITFDEVICRSEFDFTPLSEMYATHCEYPMGDLIADSYIYEAKENGIYYIDVALVGLGTIRGSFPKGDITVADAFEICSLGAGKDGTAGHPILVAYITGEELKLLVELDASLGPMVSSIKMSYAGLKYTFNEKRVILDRVTDLCLVRDDGTEEKIENDKLYCVACNMYAANMLGMLNGLTHGILSIVPKDSEGNPVEDFYDCALRSIYGGEIKEWIAFKNYLASFPEKDGVPTIPEKYAEPMGRKVKESRGGLVIFKNPGTTTLIVIIVPLVIIAVVVILICTRRRRKAKRLYKKEMKLQKKLKEGKR